MIIDGTVFTLTPVLTSLLPPCCPKAQSFKAASREPHPTFSTQCMPPTQQQPCERLRLVRLPPMGRLMVRVGARRRSPRMPPPSIPVQVRQPIEELKFEAAPHCPVAACIEELKEIIGMPSQIKRCRNACPSSRQRSSRRHSDNRRW